MIIKNGTIRVWRTPIITTFFLICVLLAETTFSLGINLWLQNHQRIMQYENDFTTIATAEQVKTGVRKVEQWDAGAAEYKIYQLPQYGNKLSPEVLNCDGINYIDKPEKRAFYKSYASEYELAMNNSVSDCAVAEFEPVDTCVPNQSVPVKIKSVLSKETEAIKPGNILFFCNHDEAEPEQLEVGQTYIAFLTIGNQVHGDGFEDSQTYEYHPVSIRSSQADKKGVRVSGRLSDQYLSGDGLDNYYMVDDAFNQSEMAEYYKNYTQAIDRESVSLPVTATGNIELLMAFHNQNAYITKGAKISEKEYDNGEKVCLVSGDFAKNNELKVGDTVELDLYAAYQGLPATSSFYVQSLLNAEGENYPVFEKSSYKIKGIYDSVPGMIEQSYGVAQNEIFIPSNSIKNSDENNIAIDTVMSPDTTSFSIANGTIDEFLKVWNKKGTEELNITFYDGGYSKFERGLNNMKIFSMCLAIIGTVMIGLVLILYSYIFVMQQKEAIVTERLLGITKSQSMISMGVGAFLVLGVGSVCGGILGVFLFEKMPQSFLNASYFDTTYSYNTVKAMGKTLTMEAIRPEVGVCVGGVIIILGGVLLVCYKVRKILQMELIQILGKSE